MSPITALCRMSALTSLGLLLFLSLLIKQRLFYYPLITEKSNFYYQLKGTSLGLCIIYSHLY